MMHSTLEQPLIRIDSEVTRRVRRHARAHMQTEVCGVLIGKLSDGVIEIEAPIEAFNASQAGAHVTFTQAAWETIYRVKDKQYPQERIVGWYHSHPGFGVFLSDHDTFIHRNFFSSPDQVAWVYDPHSDEEGCFGWVDGAIRRLASIYVADSSGFELQPTTKPSERSLAAPQKEALFQPTLQPTPQAAVATQELPAPLLDERPGFLRGLDVPMQKALLAGLYFGHLLKRWWAPANAGLLTGQTGAISSGLTGVEDPSHVSSDAQSGDNPKQLSPECGK